jgi:hypothetical protein
VTARDDVLVTVDTDRVSILLYLDDQLKTALSKMIDAVNAD